MISPTQPEELVSAQQKRRQLASGEEHPYFLRLKTGEYVRIIAEQRGVDLLLRLIAPGGTKLIAEVDSPTGTRSFEQVSEIAETSGDYRVEVIGGEETPAGEYEIRIEERRMATEADHKRVKGERVLWEGEVLRRAEKFEDAITRYEQALRLWQEAGDRAGEAEALSRIGWMHDRMNRWEEAVDLSMRAASLYRQIGGEDGQAGALNRAGRLLIRLSRSEEALALLEEAVRLFRSTLDPDGEASALANLVNVHLWSGRFLEAAEVYEQLLSVSRRIGDPLGETIALLGQGDLYIRHEKWVEARSRFECAQRSAERSGHRVLAAEALESLGALDYRDGRLAESRAWSERALALYRELGDCRGQAVALNSLGSVLLKEGDLEAARTRYEEARALSCDLSDVRGEATATSHLACVAFTSGDARAAYSLQLEALAGFERLHDWLGISLSHYGIAQALYKIGDLEGALQEIEVTLDLAERRAETDILDLRAFYFATRQHYWELYIDVLMSLDRLRPSQGFARRALEANERRQVRVLRSALAETRADARRTTEPALQKEEAELRQRLARAGDPAEASHLFALLDALAETRADVRRTTELALLERVAELRRRLAQSEEPPEESDLLDRLDRVHTRMRASALGLARIEDTRSLSLVEIQQKLLDRDTLLLIYSLGEKRSFLWTVTRSTLASFELPPRERIEAAAYLFHNVVSIRLPGSKLRQAAVDDLSELILEPVAEELAKYRRLVIVADGALQKVTFGALPDPGAPPVAGRQPLLVERHPISYLPSASVGVTLRREWRDASQRTGAGPLVAVLADPVFDSSDPRVSRAAAAPPPADDATRSFLGRAMRSVGISRLERLPFSREEALAIQELLHRSGDVLPVLDFAANRQVLDDERWRRAPILHFATHVLLDDRQAELSGIVFSLVNPDGSIRPDGFLRLHEIYGLALDADLVVLSACQFPSGKELRGEGLLGLIRGFLSIGAPQLIVSLWKVEDRASSELMTRFYRELFEGYRPPDALQRAQRSMLDDPIWEDPALWSGFIFVGGYDRQPGGGIEARDTGGTDTVRRADAGGLPPPKVKPKPPKRERGL